MLGQLGASVDEEIKDLVLRGKAIEVGTVATLPAGVREITIDEAKSLFDPWFKKWWVWAIAGGVVVGGGLVIYRRRRR